MYFIFSHFFHIHKHWLESCLSSYLIVPLLSQNKRFFSMHSWWNGDCSNHYTSCVQHINRTATAIPHKTLITAEDIFNIITHKTCKKENLSSNNTMCLLKSQETLWIKPWSKQKTLVLEEHETLQVLPGGMNGIHRKLLYSMLPAILVTLQFLFMLLLKSMLCIQR